MNRPDVPLKLYFLTLAVMPESLKNSVISCYAGAFGVDPAVGKKRCNIQIVIFILLVGLRW